MWNLLLATALALPSGGTIPPMAADTVEVRAGDVLVIENLTGEVLVEGTDDDVAQLIAGRSGMRLERRGSRILLDVPRRGDDVSVHLRVPRSVEVRIGGAELDVVLEGMRGGIEVDLLTGDVTAHDVAGGVRVATLDGDLRVFDAEGSVALTSLSGSLEVRRVQGDVFLDSTDGDLTLDEVTASSVRAQTVDGDIEFEGDVARGGTLSLITHDGDVVARVSPEMTADVEVGTFDGNFQSDFPVRVQRLTAGRELRFAIGGGGRTLILRSFDGDIRLLHRGR